MVDTSDELIDNAVIDNLISGHVTPGPEKVKTGKSHQLAVKPGPSNHADQMIHEAEPNRAHLTATPGETNMGGLTNFLHSAFVDEEYLVIGSHVDETLCSKIINHEYVGFARFLPRDRVFQEEDQRMELVNRNGMTYWTPMVDKELGTITSFSRWDVAFRVFSNIYMTKYPHKSSELIQYCHVIHTASLTYVWENVYFYDKEFHIQILRHPQRSWAIILQQVWNLRLKDKLKHDSFTDRGHQKSKEICKRFNRGKCHNGMSCHYKHRCLNCGKFGHSGHICRHKKQDLDRYNSPSKTNQPVANVNMTKDEKCTSSSSSQNNRN